MLLAILMYVAVAAFVVGNVYRIVRIARMPAHLRWELYPAPKGTAERQRYGGSYFEESEWWKTGPRSSRSSELAYIAAEVCLFRTLWKRNRPLWLWSWLMHAGLYGLVLTYTLTLLAALTRAPLARTIWATAFLASCAGIAGAAGLTWRRVSDSALRTYTVRADILNLALLAALFVSMLATIAGEPAFGTIAIDFARALMFADKLPQVSVVAAVHIVCVAVFLAYFPVSHMTHAYMKFFSYHRVRWDDTAVVHDAAMARAMRANVLRPISWAAPHIRPANTWAEAVRRPEAKERT